MIAPKEFGVKPDTEPSKGFRQLANECFAWLRDIMECNGSAADPHSISRVGEMHTLSLDKIKSKVEGGEVVGQLLIPHREAMAIGKDLLTSSA